MNRPRVIVADEPTPGLDMELAVQAMEDFRCFADDGGGMLLITHDIELALRVADRIAVFKDGTVVEETAVASFSSPALLQHPFSRTLWHALPEHGMKTSAEDRSDAPAPLVPLSSAFHPAAPEDPTKPHINGENEEVAARSLQAKGVCFNYGTQSVLKDFDLKVRPGERVALHAPSGTGKTTLCRILAGYLQPSAGEVLADGVPLPRKGASPVQLIAQHPERMMDPAITVRQSLFEAAIAAEDARALIAWESDGGESESPVPQLLDALGVQRAWFERFPSELSGGELQRCCIARALIAQPHYVVCDEISTMLDAATQASLWRFLIRYTQANGIGMVLVTHSDALLAHVATRVVELPNTRSR